MAARLMLGLMLFAAGIVFGWQMRAQMAERHCAEAGGTWYLGACRGAR